MPIIIDFLSFFFIFYVKTYIIMTKSKHIHRVKGFWNNYENCYQAALKCSSRNELRVKYYCAYDFFRRNNLLDTLEWLKPKLTYWTDEKVLEESKKYQSRAEFQKNCGSGYIYARKKGLLTSMIWLNEQCKPNGYWHEKVNCIEESKKYQSRVEFQKKSIGAYVVSRKNGWLDEMTWLQTPKNTERTRSNKYVVYSYEVQQTNSVYVGLTINLIRRHYQHNSKQRRKNKNEVKYYYDSIKQHCIDNKLVLVKPKILEENLTSNEAQCQEKYWLERYIKNGWNILNKGKCGENISSLGGYYKKEVK